jgi:hypothetical protein
MDFAQLPPPPDKPEIRKPKFETRNNFKIQISKTRRRIINQQEKERAPKPF